MLRVASLVRQLASGQRVGLIIRSTHYAASRKQLLSPPRLLRIQQQYATSAHTLTEASDKLYQSGSVNLSANHSWNHYEGEGLDGIVHGHGQCAADDGRIYLGELIEGKRDGHGKITYPNGLTHEGEFQSDMFVSGRGSIVYQDGAIYNGGVDGGKAHGQGKMVYVDGNERQGRFENGDFVEGTITYANGDEMVGEFRQGRLWNGTGVLRLKNGTVYEGAFKESEMHGQGKMLFSDGTSWEGCWEAGAFTEGKITYAQGKMFEGMWVGKELVKGKITNVNGDTMEGEFKEGKMHGQGRLTRVDGSYSEGEFRDGKLWNGKGMSKLKNGDIFEGEFKDSRKHGQGKLTYANGECFEGEFKEGLRYQGKLTLADASKMEGEFKAGKLWKGVSTTKEGVVTAVWKFGKHKATNVKHSVARIVPAAARVSFPFTAKNGAVFDGVYLDKTKKRGKGQIKYTDGSVYEGEWLKDKRHGAGRLTSAAGEVFEGVFEKDVPVSGKGVLPLKTGGKYEGELVEGKRHGLTKFTNKEGVVENADFVHGKKVRRTPWQMTMVDGTLLLGELREGTFYGRMTASDGRELQCECVEGRIVNGTGVLNLSDGSVYEGEFKYSKRHGQGKIIHPDGRSHEGEFREGKIWNGTGVLVVKNGDVFEGEIREGKAFSGKGVVSMKDGSVYDGAWVEGLMVTGTITRANGGALHGDFKDGKIVNGVSFKKDGRVTKRWVEGKLQKIDPAAVVLSDKTGEVSGGHHSWEEGELAHDKKVKSEEMPMLVEGPRIITYKDGAVYEGDLLEGKRHGQGKLNGADGTVREGRWENGLLVEGKSVYSNGNTFEGKWIDKKFVQGKVSYSSGDRAEGEFNEGKIFNGKGLFKLQSGDVYEGEFKKGKRDGQGKLTYAKGGYFEGEFQNGTIWTGEWINKDGVLTQRYENGKSQAVVIQSEPEAVVESASVVGLQLPVQLTKNQGAVFNGVCLVEGKKHGAGELILKDGSKYEGELVEGNGHGQGKITLPDGRTLEGVFRDYKLYTGRGSIRFKDGSVYEGALLENKKHGEGKLVFLDGTVWEGRWENGQLVQGRTVDSLGYMKVGTWANKKLTNGKIISPSGIVKEGEFKNGKMWNGVKMKADGCITQRWVEGKKMDVFPTGTGTSSSSAYGNDLSANMTEKSLHGGVKLQVTHQSEPLATRLQFTNKQGALFEGVYLDASKKHGKGQIKYPDGCVYEGEWLKDKRHGAGRLTSAAGEVFEGVFEKDVPVSGKGVLTLKTGGKYEGELVEGKRHGLAKITNKEGVAEMVTYVHGKKVREKSKNIPEESSSENASKEHLYTGTMHMSNGSVFTGEWRAGKFYGQTNASDGTVMEAECEDGKILNGTGVLTLKSKDVYEGAWKDGKMHGPGKLTSADGRTLEGEFEDDRFYSGAGSVRYKDGSVYAGTVFEGNRHGQGKLTFVNGTVWEGRWEKGELVQGKIAYPDGKMCEGIFAGKELVKGKIISSNGDTENIQLRDDKISNEVTVLRKGLAAKRRAEGKPTNGYSSLSDSAPSSDSDRRSEFAHEESVQTPLPAFAQMTMLDGSVLEGEWRAGRFYGKTVASDGRVLECECAEGKILNGAGVLKLMSGNTYEGEFKAGLLHGQGKLTYLDGRTQDGEFREGLLFNGSGTFLSRDGSMFEGTLREGRKHGQGKLTYVDGIVKEGRWGAGELTEGKKIYPNGKIYDGVWVKTSLLKGKVISPNGDVVEGEFKGGKMWSGASVRKDGCVVKRWVDGKPIKTAVVADVAAAIAAPSARTVLVEEPQMFAPQTTPPAESAEENEAKSDSLTDADVSSVYVGSTQEGKKHGLGKLTCADGIVWEGRWANGDLVQGKCTTAEVQMEGTWAKSFLIKGRMTYTNGDKVTGEFREGKIWNGRGKLGSLEGEFKEGELCAP